MGLTRSHAFIAGALLSAATLHPGVSSAQSVDDLIKSGRAQLDSNKADDAVKTFEKAVKASPNSSDAHLWLARAVGTVAGNANVLRQPFLGKRAKAEFDKAVELDPNSVGGREGLLQFYLRAPSVIGGSVQKAREQAAAIAKVSALRGHFADANVANHEKDPAGVEKAYRAAATEFPDSLVAVQAIVNFVTNNNRAEEAFPVLDRYLAKHADDRVALFWIGRAAAITGKQLDRGEQALKSVLASQGSAPPNGPRVATEAVHLRLGDIAAKRGDKVRARAAYDEALRINPKFEPAKKALAAL
jgi:tetratricopeptide (TPR) repeat protein